MVGGLYHELALTIADSSLPNSSLGTTRATASHPPQAPNRRAPTLPAV